VRAGAGAVLLLGVTVAVQGMTETNTPVTAEAADIVVVPSAVPTTDPLGNPDLRQQSLSAATRAQALAQEARAQAAKEAARSAARRAEQARAAKAAAAKAAAAKAAATKAAAARRAAAAKAATARAAAAKAAARAAKARSSAANRPIRSGDARSIARQLLAARGWSGQFGCLNSLWQRESGWNSRAMNPSSGAYGIPQALPGSKMASAGADWRTNPATQIRWGLSYIASRYGTPCGAWAHSQSHGWY
jgi:murein DD-endopeptidase MepM/ murein hydrolase activator NlpD